MKLATIPKQDTLNDRELIGLIMALAATGSSKETLAKLQRESKRRFNKQLK